LVISRIGLERKNNIAMNTFWKKTKIWVAIGIIAIIYLTTACVLFIEQVDNRENMKICPLCNMEVHK
jgi:hypothetical protein